MGEDPLILVGVARGHLVPRIGRPPGASRRRSHRRGRGQRGVSPAAISASENGSTSVAHERSRNSVNGAVADATKGKPAARASRAVRPKPSFVDGNARAPARWNSATMSASSTTPSSAMAPRVPGSRPASSASYAARYAPWSSTVAPPTIQSRAPVFSRRWRSRANARTSRTVFLRAATPPVARTSGRAWAEPFSPGRHPGARGRPSARCPRRCRR